MTSHCVYCGSPCVLWRFPWVRGACCDCVREVREERRRSSGCRIFTREPNRAREFEARGVKWFYFRDHWRTA